MSKAISLTIETQTEDRQVLCLCHVNEKMLSLETSFIANKMFRFNRPLFDKINSTTKLIGGTLYRQSVVQVKGSKNGVYVPIKNRHESKEKEISRLFFEDNILKKQVRAISKQGKKFDFDPTKVSAENDGGFFSANKLSPQDIKSSTLISSVEEIVLFQDQGVKSFFIMDDLQKEKSLLEVGYRVQLIVDTDFKSYLNYVINHAEQSLKFLTSYSNSLSYSSAYDGEKLSFKTDFSQRILSSIGIQMSDTSLNLNTERIRSSDFGKSAIAYYNLSSLLTKSVSKSVYGKILTILLPTEKTTPSSINMFIRNFTSILETVKFEYLKGEKQDKKERKYSRVSEGTIRTNVIHATTKERLEIDQERLGYSVFSNKSGLNQFSSEDYKRRWAKEQAKYYPNIQVEDTSGFMTSAERGRFSNIGNAAAFLTPTSLVMGDKRIKTNRGMRNINVDEIRQFRLAKSIRAQQQKATKFPQSTAKNTLSLDSLSSLNVTISKPYTPILQRSTDEEIDPLIDARHYVGEDVGFVTNNPIALLKRFKRIQTEEERRALSIASDIIPRRMLRSKRAINSIQEIQFSNPKSLVRKLVTEGDLRIESIPPHIKQMMSKSFKPNPDSDPLKNRESSQIIQETQQNIFQIRALTGFKLGPLGFLDVHMPIYTQMDSSAMSAGRPMIAKAFDYEVPELGIVKDNFLATIYSNLIYIRG